MSSSPDVLAGSTDRHTDQHTAQLTGPLAGRLSTQRSVLGTDNARVTAVQPRELRTGAWTRLGSSTVLGDAVTERTLAGLVEEAQAAARAQGYSRGWAEGRRAAEEQAAVQRAAVLAQQHRAEELRAAEHATAVAGLAGAAARLDQAVSLVCQQVEAQALELAAQLAEAIIGRELAVAENPGLDAVRRALALAQGDAVVRVRVRPEDHTPELAELTGAAVVVADPTLAPGDAVLETADGVIDARVTTAMERVSALLRS